MHRFFPLAAVCCGLATVTLAASCTADPAPRLAQAPANAALSIPAGDARLRYSGRFDWREAGGPRCQWPASAVTVRFRGTGISARLKEGGKDRWQVVVDGQPTIVLDLREGEHLYPLAGDLAGKEHTVQIVKCTESFVGTTQILGFELPHGSRILEQTPPARRIEVIGDSISAGYGNEAASEKEHFSPATENAYRTYGAIAARALNADYSCLAWSGRKMWPDNTLPEIYDRALPLDAGSTWDFSKWQPDVVLINLATNDFGKGPPDEKGWTGAYKEFIARVRKNYPQAHIYCAIGTMMGDWGEHKSLTILRGYIDSIVKDVQAGGEDKIHVIDFGTQDAKNGLGADWHPSVKTHEVMAKQLEATLRRDLKW
jgi:lysophospholipase L1-like esterase